MDMISTLKKNSENEISQEAIYNDIHKLEKNNEYKNNNIGSWGGNCTCPDGQVYIVGDNMDFCKSLACEGGVSGKCTQNFAANNNRSGYGVKCANSFKSNKSLIENKNNI